MTIPSFLPSIAVGYVLANPFSTFEFNHYIEAVDTQTAILEGDRMILKDQLVLTGASESANRIVAASYLRTLSQEIASAACHLNQDVGVETATELLAYSVAKFDALTLALRDGDEAMGVVGGETRPRTVAELEDLITAWIPVRDASIKLLQSPADTEHASIIYDSADDLYERSYAFLSTIESQYAVPSEIAFRDVVLLEISARMAAVTQRISYEACRVMSGEADESYAVELAAAKDIFRNSLLALSNGEPAMGILPAPTPEIADALTDIGADWQIIDATLQRVLGGEQLAMAEREELYLLMVDKLHKAEVIEELYKVNAVGD